MITISSTLYEFNQNRRVYRRKLDGTSYGAPIFEEYFQPVQVTGETKVSWIVGPDWAQSKVNKKEILTGRAGVFFTKAGMEDEIFKNDNAIEIANLVKSQSADVLRQIAKILNYEVEG